MGDCGYETPLAHFFRFADAEQPWLVVHLNKLADSDFDLLRGLKPSLRIIHCPRSHAYFGHSPFQFQRLRELGFNVCLGTDSLASNDDLSLFAEMRAFQKEFPNVAAEEILEMATIRSALALGKPHVLGRIRQNYVADLVALPITRSTSVFEEIIQFDKRVAWLMIGGQVQNPA